MRDIGFPALDRLLLVFYVFIIVGFPVLIGVGFLVLHTFVHSRRGMWTALYFATSMVAVVAGMWWWSVHFNDPASLIYALPMALGSSVGIFILFLLAHRINALMREKKAGKG